MINQRVPEIFHRFQAGTERANDEGGREQNKDQRRPDAANPSYNEIDCGLFLEETVGDEQAANEKEYFYGDGTGVDSVVFEVAADGIPFQVYTPRISLNDKSVAVKYQACGKKPDQIEVVGVLFEQLGQFVSGNFQRTWKFAICSYSSLRLLM